MVGCPNDYLEGCGDFVSRLIISLIRVTIWIIGIIILPTRPPDPPSKAIRGLEGCPAKESLQEPFETLTC